MGQYSLSLLLMVAVISVFGSVIVSLTCTYTSPFRYLFTNLANNAVRYTESSFVSTQFFIFNLDCWLGDNISYYHIIFRSSVVFFLFLVDIYLPLDIYLSNPIFSASVSIVYELFCGGVLETYVIMSVILLPIKSPVTSAVFLISLFEAVLVASATDCLA